jgi:KaiC/GvpD/RAD55 family RecA-like ATPase
LSATARVKTGIPGLDEVLEGGLLRNYAYSIVGPPGVGKTTMASQFLFRGATQYSESGLLVSLQEPPFIIANNMMRFGWNLFDLESQGRLVLIDSAPYQEQPGAEMKIRGGVLASESFTLDGLLGAVAAARKKVAAKRCVIDSLDVIAGVYKSEPEYRFKLIQFFRALSELELTTLILTDAPTRSIEKFGIESILASGCLILHDSEDKDAQSRVMEIQKIRGVKPMRRSLDYKITPDGLEVSMRSST